MKSVHIRQIDEEVLKDLKRRARQHRRSLQKEIESLLEDAAKMTPPEESSRSVADSLHIISGGNSPSTWSREDIYAEDGR